MDLWERILSVFDLELTEYFFKEKIIEIFIKRIEERIKF